eukprot:TRINITY_DN13624_c0_g1_i1.p1 TRINITY_DN13624_c0_g1~~TRINITY_DN13624_c0_g1_i1.p1  ORF type:complete len:234 (+),score=36.66 TRINITY_DN13624_c0_g1_i1:170-871(+)
MNRNATRNYSLLHKLYPTTIRWLKQVKFNEAKFSNTQFHKEYLHTQVIVQEKVKRRQDEIIRQRDQFKAFRNVSKDALMLSLRNEKSNTFSKTATQKNAIELRFNIRDKIPKRNERTNTAKQLLNRWRTRSKQGLTKSHCNSRNGVLKLRKKNLTGIIKCVKFNTREAIRLHTAHNTRNHKRLLNCATSKGKEKLRPHTVQGVRTIISGSKVEFFIPNCKPHTRNNSIGEYID